MLHVVTCCYDLYVKFDDMNHIQVVFKSITTIDTSRTQVVTSRNDPTSFRFINGTINIKHFKTKNLIK